MSRKFVNIYFLWAKIKWGRGSAVLFGSWAELAPSLGPELRLQKPPNRPNFRLENQTRDPEKKKRHHFVRRLVLSHSTRIAFRLGTLAKTRYCRLGVRTTLAGRYKKMCFSMLRMHSVNGNKIKFLKNFWQAKLHFKIKNCTCKINMILTIFQTFHV